jgi:hypothetical protein
LNAYSISHVAVHKLDTNQTDTITMLVGRFHRALPGAEQRRMTVWLKNRLQVDSLQLITQVD